MNNDNSNEVQAGKTPCPLLATPPNTFTAGMGCFWGPDAFFSKLDGVEWCRVGYSGGTQAYPTYRSIGDHTEVVQVKYDPALLSFESLLDAFFVEHTGWRGSRSSKRQYDSGLWYQNTDQLRAIEAKIAQVEAQTGSKVTSRVEPLGDYYNAEAYHQQFHEKHER
ncbi:MAG: hypothetical protein GVY36_03625 [Verrucomicrobia bacterium]|jgi:peptide-methionine (S)-S-oxide reductase|nr:hypothetical protein [Verrucomicrobiota bacterium]